MNYKQRGSRTAVCNIFVTIPPTGSFPQLSVENTISLPERGRGGGAEEGSLDLLPSIVGVRGNNGEGGDLRTGGLRPRLQVLTIILYINTCIIVLIMLKVNEG